MTMHVSISPHQGLPHKQTDMDRFPLQALAMTEDLIAHAQLMAWCYYESRPFLLQAELSWISCDST